MFRVAFDRAVVLFSEKHNRFSSVVVHDYIHGTTDSKEAVKHVRANSDGRLQSVLYCVCVCVYLLLAVLCSFTSTWAISCWAGVLPCRGVVANVPVVY